MIISGKQISRGSKNFLNSGNNFALIEMVLTLFELFSKFRLEKDFDTIKFLPFMTLKPVGIQAKIQTRK